MLMIMMTTKKRKRKRRRKNKNLNRLQAALGTRSALAKMLTVYLNYGILYFVYIFYLNTFM